MTKDMTIDDVRQKLAGEGLSIKSEQRLGNGSGTQIKLANGGIVNVFDKGSINFQGKGADKVRAAIEGVPTGASVAESPPTYGANKSNRVFIVHGHDSQSKEQLELILHKLGLDHFVLANSSGGGLTIIEALEQEIGPNQPGARFGIVLMTPDDVGYSKADGDKKSEPRARQNVVLEMGMLISSVGRTKVAILKKGHLEVPSDAQGILYISFNDHVREAVPRLVDHLQKAGFTITPQQITRASS